MKHPISNYLQKRKNEVDPSPSIRARGVVESGFDFIETCFVPRFDELTPDVIRKISSIEAILFVFVEHGLKPEKLDKIDADIALLGLREVH